jgi:hypothetical protein
LLRFTLTMTQKDKSLKARFFCDAAEW